MYVTVQMCRTRTTSEQTLYSENFSIQLSDHSYIILTNKPTYGYMHPIVCSHVGLLTEHDTKQVTAQVKRTLLKI